MENQNKAMTLKWLNRLRHDNCRYTFALFVGYLRERLADGHLSLADIGTSEEELEELRIKGYKLAKTCATQVLDYVRNFFGSYDVYAFDHYIACIRAQIAYGHLSLLDIGTSEEELEELRIKLT